MRIVLTFFALTLLQVPYLKLVGAALLLWIAIKLLRPGDDGHGSVEGSDQLWTAVKTVVIADLVMSLDNVVAIAGTAESAGSDHKMLLVVLGLLISIPIIVAGSQLLMKIMGRFPVVVVLGAMLLGWIAGTMAATDPALATILPDAGVLKVAWGTAGVVAVLVVGKFLVRRSR
jgi:YjbE family integral membrane protein